MHLSTVFALISAASLGAAAPALPARSSDPTVCAAGTGFFQSCSNGFRGCCKADACTLGYCPPPTTNAPAEEKPKTDEWTHKAEPETWKPATLPEGQCAAGTGYYQVCGNGFKGCCSADACHLGYCPPAAVAARNVAAAAEEEVKRDETVCAAGTGYFQSCGNGFRGCCTADACGLGYCPGKSAEPTKPTEEKPKTDDWTHKAEPETWKPATLPEGQCAAGTGYYQVCGNGFKGCCTKDACHLGYCPL